METLGFKSCFCTTGSMLQGKSLNFSNTQKYLANEMETTTVSGCDCED